MCDWLRINTLTELFFQTFADEDCDYDNSGQQLRILEELKRNVTCECDLNVMCECDLNVMCECDLNVMCECDLNVV